MPPIIRHIKLKSPFPLSETKINVGLDKTQDITLKLLLHSAEIYLVQEELSKNKENCVSLNKGVERDPKEIAPYKDRPSKGILQMR